MQTNTFDQFIEYLLSAEGEYANDVEDRGGETFWGLSSKFMDGIGWGETPPTRQEAIDIYNKYFWHGYRCNEMHPFVAWCACDGYIQHPPTIVIRLLQTGLGVPVDGSMGPVTMEAAKNPNIVTFWRTYRLARIRYYNVIVRNDPTQSKFIDGWHERMHKLSEGMYFAGVISSEATGVKAAITSPTAKATALGTIFAVITGGLAYLGIEPTDAMAWLTSVVPTGGTLGLAVAWIAKTQFKQG